MAIVVENAMDQVKAYSEGNGIFPVPPEVKADNEAQAAKAAKTEETPKVESKETPKLKAQEAKKAIDNAVAADSEAAKTAEADDIENEQGITPRQQRELSDSMLKTIAKQHARRRDAEEFARHEHQAARLSDERASKLEADLVALREQLKPAPVAEELKEPQRDAFKTDQEYWDAMVDFRVDKKLRASHAAQAQAEAERFAEESKAHAQAKMDRALEQGPEDFKEVYEASDMVLPTYVLETIKESDLMSELVYFLGTHEAEGERIAALTKGLRPGTPQFIKAAQRQLVEIGKIESTLTPFSKEKAKNGEEPSTTGKPEPETGSAPSKPRVTAPIIAPLASGGASQVEKDEANLTHSQAIARWQKKHNVNLTARKRH